MFFKEIKELPPPDKLPEVLEELMIFDDVKNIGKNQLLKKSFCRGRHNDCNMIYLDQNLFSLDRRGVNVQSGNVIHPLYKHSLMKLNMTMKILLLLLLRYLQSLISILFLMYLKIEILMVN